MNTEEKIEQLILVPELPVVENKEPIEEYEIGEINRG